MMKTLASLRSDSWTTSAGSGGHLPPDHLDNFTGLRKKGAEHTPLPQGALVHVHFRYQRELLSDLNSVLSMFLGFMFTSLSIQDLMMLPDDSSSPCIVPSANILVC